MSDIRVTPQSWLWRPRTKPIKLIEIHATRGDTVPAKQKSAALNWVQSPNNNQEGWGSSFSHVIGADGSQGTVLNDDQMPTYSAGYGGPGSEWAIDEYAISYELAQSADQEPFTDACLRRAAKEIAAKCRRYGIPPAFVEIPVQSGPVPTGLVRHDRCQNGYVLGKTDPGTQFDEAQFLALLKAALQENEQEQEEDDMLIAIQREGSGAVYVTDGIYRWGVPNPTMWRELQATKIVAPGLTKLTKATFDRIRLVPSPLTKADVTAAVKAALPATGSLTEAQIEAAVLRAAKTLKWVLG